jgi:3-phosphoshikimate 1-carboxyvinyltransferase
MDAMKQHDVMVETYNDMSVLRVAPRQQYQPAEYPIAGDYSSAAFMLSAAAVTESKMRISGLPRDERDPDSAIIGILRQMGAELSFLSGKLEVEGRPLTGAKVNICDCPDLGPVLAVLGTQAHGETIITGAERLRYKESDRLGAMALELGTLGAKIRETDGGLLVSGPCTLTGGTVDSHSDHRVAMALAVAALHSRGTVTIRNAQCVSKSYPTFFDDLRLLGVEAIER